MKMKQISAVIIAMGLVFLFSCKGKPKDSELQAKVTEKLNAVPGVTAETKDGVVTLSGSVTDEAAKSSAEEMAKLTEGVKSVTNNIVVAPPPVTAPPPPAVTADDPLRTGVEAIIKDFQGVQATVEDGVIKVSGELSATRWKTLKMALDGLKPKKVDATGLKIK
ncbi:BON domain-containing protein [Chitinophaga tropicalis]|nr:BON domain-containing protein [Chitinophaga tropicalis]